MVKTGNKLSEKLTDKQLRKMVEYFGLDRLPDPDNYPLSFQYYIKIYKYIKIK